MDTCTSEFERLVDRLGGVACDDVGLLTLTSPLALDSWTQPVLELLWISGAVGALLHALRRRRDGDSSYLLAWLGGLAVTFLFEPICYFPQWFGVEDSLGLPFVHNQFTVQLLYNRLPLYIVAMYPVFTYVAYCLVRRAGVFERRGEIVGALCVGATVTSLFEPADMVAQQLGWWVWNTDFPAGNPVVGAVPVACLQTFSFAIPAGLVLVARRLDRRGAGGPGRTVGLGVVTALGALLLMMLTYVPGTVLRLLGASQDDGLLAGYWIVIGSGVAVALWGYVDAWRARRDGEPVPVGSAGRDPFGPICALVYLAATVAFWIESLPAYRAGVDGSTRDGLTLGSAPFAVATFVLGLVLLTLATTAPAKAGAQMTSDDGSGHGRTKQTHG